MPFVLKMTCYEMTIKYKYAVFGKRIYLYNDKSLLLYVFNMIYKLLKSIYSQSKKRFP